MNRLRNGRRGIAALAVLGFSLLGTPAHAVEDPGSIDRQGPLTAPRPLVQIGDAAIKESSGLVTSTNGELLYTVQDAGLPAEVYGLLRSNGERRVTIRLPGTKNLDWEDIDRGTDEAGKPALFIADTGDAYLVRNPKGLPARRDFAIYRIAAPELPTDGPPVVQNAAGLTRWNFVYEDRKPRNSESLAVQPGTNAIFLIDKNDEIPGKPAPAPAVVWAAPAKLSTTRPNILTRVSSVPLSEATAATFSPDGKVFAVRDYASAYLWRVPDGDLQAAVREQPIEIPLPVQRQGESLTFAADGSRLYAGSEGEAATIWEVPLPASLEAAPAAATNAAPATTAPPVAGTRRRTLALFGVCGFGLLVLAAAALITNARRRREEREIRAGRRRA